jgi:bifunctional non-homologous end joining protein LigD
MTMEVGGRELRIAHLDRVLYPETGTTKAQLLDYYVRVSPVMLPHLAERLLHMHRYPEGVTGPRFWQKQCPDFRPEWMPIARVWSRDKGADIEFCVVNELPALLWAINLGSLELHTSLHTRADLDRPTTLAFDLDPGEAAGLAECCEVGLLLRDMLAGVGLRAFAKTSGGKGLQVYVPLNDPAATYEKTKPLARGIAELLESHRGDLVISQMARERRRGRVLIDWSQNTPHKSMVCAYSVRARSWPAVSTPVSWDEVEAGDPKALVFGMDDVLARVERDGDRFAEVLALRQRLP